MAQVSLPWLQRLLDAQSVASLREGVAKFNPTLATVPERIAILGAADEGERLVQLCADNGIVVAAWVDDDPNRLGNTVQGVTVAGSDTLGGLDRAVPVIIASHRVLKASQRLKAAGFATVAPFVALQLLHPSVFPPQMFYDGWLEDMFANRDRLRALAERLADDRSRQVLDAVLAFRQTAQAEMLEPVVEWDLYESAELFRFGEDEVYVDGGTFDGDTIRLFIARTKGRFNRVIGFEPDPKTFSVLAANFADEPRVEPVNAGLFSHKTTLRFHDNASRASILGDTGTVEVPVVALDDILAGDRVTYIKMNIEGAELPALDGASASIRTWKPRLAISAYHRAADLWEIAAKVDAIDPSYRLYLRQHDGGVIETVLYAVP